MKKTLLLLSAAAAFTVASCSDNKTAETTTTTTTTESSSSTNASAGDMDVEYRNRAGRIADQMASDMKITDTAVVSRIRTTYYNRARRMGELRTKYTADTAGMAAEMRTVYAETDSEFKGYLPAESYTTYESSRTNYYDERFMDGSDMSSSSSSSMDNSGSTPTSAMEPGSKMKNDDGSKVKIKADGDVKIKDAEGNKMKMDGDDGTVKMKPEEGDKTKIK
ncbi:hypothetical protein [Hymenobacter weizhouensis]|uniref:hypothetical protein n=1 Tax=Hymenobacter sp. YIM 151500-1 TaxID=2987689 RepID=UPI0022270936|nr:hypothetical protein [Hymenobacter sp. YIM 151500-1]UYZ61552.1 hypothetical protein OIS53_11090 [Hymenobacter sp. YIM 151500-1]